jgi:hypothetical protein
LSRFLRICSQSLKKVLIWPLQNFFLKKSKKVSKNAEFHADFKSVEKVLKKCTKKKLLAKTWRKNAFTHVCQTCFAYNFFLVHFFTTFSPDSKSAWNSASFDTFFDFLGYISTFFELWSQTRKKRLKKSKKVFSKCVLDFNFAPIKGSVFFIF